MKVLMSAYACEPGKGSEPEVGWRVAIGMAEHCEMRVITRANNRASIERACAGMREPLPVFLYYDLPAVFLWLKRRLLGIGPYYVLWQMAIRWHFRKELKEADLIHHVTFNGIQLPGFWVATKTPVILGPLGGGMTCPAELLPPCGRAKYREILRTLLIRCLRFLPLWRWSIKSARVVIAANRDTARLLQAHRKEPVEVRLETGLTDEAVAVAPVARERGGKFRLLWLGHLIPRKAPILALRAMAKALESDVGIELVIAGGGPDEEMLRAEAGRLGISGQVMFPGNVAKDQVNRLMDDADAFIFTSIRDTSGNVVLEAMSRGLPVVTFWHQGVREICDPGCAMCVEPASIGEVVDGLARAIVTLAGDRELARRLGEAGRIKVATRLTWTNYCKATLEVYRSVHEVGAPPED